MNRNDYRHNWCIESSTISSDHDADTLFRPICSCGWVGKWDRALGEAYLIADQHATWMASADDAPTSTTASSKPIPVLLEGHVCWCGNTAEKDGFSPCDAFGVLVEPDSEWDGFYVCERCGSFYQAPRGLDAPTRELFEIQARLNRNIKRMVQGGKRFRGCECASAEGHAGFCLGPYCDCHG